MKEDAFVRNQDGFAILPHACNTIRLLLSSDDGLFKYKKHFTPECSGETGFYVLYSLKDLAYSERSRLRHFRVRVVLICGTFCVQNELLFF